jgi:hypothetical protein
MKMANPAQTELYAVTVVAALIGLAAIGMLALAVVGLLG